jgi:hypothetical protein
MFVRSADHICRPDPGDTVNSKIPVRLEAERLDAESQRKLPGKAAGEPRL